jgi:hypothetical protein
MSQGSADAGSAAPSFPGRAVPSRLRAVVTRALEAEPYRRYPSATEMESALAALNRPSAIILAAYGGLAVLPALAVLTLAGGRAAPSRGS